MGREIPLGRIAGIKVGFSWTVLLIAAIYTATLATNRFPIEHPGLSSSLYWVAGGLGALLFFASLLAHELGHALVARREGVGVQGITLWLLGGMAKLESTPKTAGAELRIAAIGPCTSALCGALFLGISVVLGGTGAVGLMGTVCEWLGILNLVLAAFNMIPAAPLDGGQVLSALLWMRSGDPRRASTVSNQVGRIVGLAMVLIGVVQLNQGGDYGFGLIFVGFFVLTSAMSELRAAPVRAALDGVRVGDVMATDPPIAADRMTIDAFLRTLPAGTTHRAYPVQVPDGRVTGLLTADSIRAVPDHNWAALTVDELAFPLDRIGVVGATEPLLAALQRAHDVATADLLVVGDDGRVVGVLDPYTVEDVLQRAHVSTGR